MIRTRFAPSPTGFMHFGSLRTALFNYLFARRHKGQFILRIEDTDVARSVPNTLENIIKTLSWAGLDYDEGPFLQNSKIVEKGKKGPYFQSKRLDIYKDCALKLIKADAAYYCFCSPQRLEELRADQMARKAPTIYDGKCQKLKNYEIKKLLSRGEKHVIRLKMPKFGKTTFVDLVHGEISFENKLIDDQILIKSDGYPTYHLAVVVDDHFMEISHVIRGEEWLPSTPKHLRIYNALSWKAPQFAHLPLILSPTGGKLSKRELSLSVLDYAEKGYLKEAVINFIAFLGWNAGDEREMFTINDLIKEFDIKKVNRSGAVFLTQKLDWYNSQYIRKTNLDELTRLSIKYLTKAKLIFQFGPDKYQNMETGEELSFEYLRQVIELEKQRLKKLEEIPELVQFIFIEPKYPKERLIWKKTSEKETKARLERLLVFFQESIEFEKNILEKNLREIIKKEKLGIGETLWPLRVALTGKEASPGPFEIAAILGREKVIKRLKNAIKLIS